jgi:hypothetical protein
MVQVIVSEQQHCSNVAKFGQFTAKGTKTEGRKGVESNLKCDGPRWRAGGELKGKLANGVDSQYPSHYLGTWCIQHYYRWCAHTRLPVLDRTDAPADLNGLVRSAERRNLVSARVPSHFNWPVLIFVRGSFDPRPILRSEGLCQWRENFAHSCSSLFKNDDESVDRQKWLMGLVGGGLTKGLKGTAIEVGIRKHA